MKKAALKTAGVTMDGYHSKALDRLAPAAGGAEPRRSFTGIGLNSMHANVAHELGEAKRKLSEFEGATLVRKLDPTCVHRSAFANRIEAEFQTPEFQLLKQEIENAGGNIQPIKVRPKKDPEGVLYGKALQYEIAYGHRRHQACRELGIPVNAVIDENLTDLDLFEVMERENRGRKNLSAWEQGCMYRDALAKGLYPSERRMADKLGINPSNLNRAVQLAKLPKAVVAAFASPLDLQVRWQKPLTDALQRDPDGVLSRARELSKNRDGLSAPQVLQRLTEGGKEVQAAATEIIVDGKSVGVLRIGPRGAVIIELAAGALRPEGQQALADLLGNFLNDAQKGALP